MGGWNGEWKEPTKHDRNHRQYFQNDYGSAQDARQPPGNLRYDGNEPQEEETLIQASITEGGENEGKREAHQDVEFAAVG
jgi:hypothetical protein